MLPIINLRLPQTVDNELCSDIFNYLGITTAFKFIYVIIVTLYSFEGT